LRDITAFLFHPFVTHERHARQAASTSRQRRECA
jgi:hypothetical protein